MNDPPSSQDNKNTRSQLERTLSHRIQSLYYQSLGKRPGKIVCQFFDQKLVVFLEDILSPTEEFLLASNREEFAQQLRHQIDESIKPKLQATLAEILGVEVLAILIDSNLEHKISGFIAVLVDIPPIRDPQTIPKVKKDKIADAGNEKQ